MRQHRYGRLAGLALALGLVVPLIPSGAGVAAEDGPDLVLGESTSSVDAQREKIDVMSIWAHPDDDAGTVTPCGVWNDRYDVRCGIIMVTRGEGGSNSVGSEAGPDLGLRRENEDRTSHVRSGTVDIFNLDRVDFYYNTSAPLTAQVWDDEETLRRTVRVIRETQPEILLGATPSMVVGHGNHQYAQGRLVWEAALAAADASRFPEQLTGVGAVETWQVKRVLSGGWGLDLEGSGAAAAEQCNTSFVPNDDVPFTVVGTWTGYDSPYLWPAGNVQGIEAGTPKTWAQAGREGYMAHPTQARSMFKDLIDPTCQQYGVTYSNAPMQPNGSPTNGDDALLYGAVIADPGGMPLGSEFAIEADEYFHGSTEPFEVTVSSRSGGASIPAGELALEVPTGWDVSEPQSFGPITADAQQTATFTVTPAADAENTVFKLGAQFSGGEISAYNDTRVALTPAVEGRFQRWGNFAEYEQWTADNDAYVGGRSDAVTRIGAGESIILPVDVTNRSSTGLDADVAVDVPAGFALDAATKTVAGLESGETETVEFVLTHTDPAAPGGTVENLTITTSAAGATSSEAVKVYLVPSAVIPELPSAPVLGGDGSEYSASLDLGRKWEGDDCAPDGVDCGAGSAAQVGWFDDALYARVTVVDDVAGAAATPDRCFGHWLVDSVELLLDPRGNSLDTSSTFKLGVFPYTDDASGSNGNGVDGPCWSRDADNHQGFSTGPLADTVEGAPNAEGVEVVASAAHDGGAYADGQYVVDVKIPFAALPAAIGATSAAPTGDATTNEIDPLYLGLNITPYDSDNQSFIGETRTAWSPFGSQQSEPYRWGHAYLDGYTPPADRPTVAPDAIIPATALQGIESPQTIFQSATRGGTISGLQPSGALSLGDGELLPDAITVPSESSSAGTARLFLYTGDARFTPVWTSSCEGDAYGFSACALEDGAATAWGPTMGGRLLASSTTDVAAGAGELVLPLDATARAAVSTGAQLLVSFADSSGAVGAWSFPVVEADTGPGDDGGDDGGNVDADADADGGGGGGDSGDDGSSGDADTAGDLATTGADPTGILIVAAVLLAAGAAVLALRRRRGAEHSADDDR